MKMSSIGIDRFKSLDLFERDAIMMVNGYWPLRNSEGYMYYNYAVIPFLNREYTIERLKRYVDGIAKSARRKLEAE